MRRQTAISLGIAALVLATGPARAQSVLTYHGDPARSGNFTMPALSWDRAHDMRPVANFAPRFDGHLYAQPLYWKPPGVGPARLIVASENNTITAIDATNGATIWNRYLGAPARLSTLPCGNIDPLGVTGTPVIDETSATLYLDAVIADRGPHHRILALSLDDGSVKAGWPVDVGNALRAQSQKFDPRVHNQRGALTMLGQTLFVPFGGHFGDCGDYRGWVVGVPVADPQTIRFLEDARQGRRHLGPGWHRQRWPFAVCRDRQHRGRYRMGRRRRGVPARSRSAPLRDKD